jgi:hypothetical protein
MSRRRWIRNRFSVGTGPHRPKSCRLRSAATMSWREYGRSGDKRQEYRISEEAARLRCAAQQGNGPFRHRATIYARLFGHKTRWHSGPIDPIATTPDWGELRGVFAPQQIRISRQTRAAGKNKMRFRPRWTAEPLLRGHRSRFQRKSCVIHRLASCQQTNV